ncbi:hypothetical protein [Acetobacterium bakii]|uniref:hypothetical protein n=1 Tax=Acetobacterium bakii TaxID=52689 RepID=UPI003BFA73C2
MIGFDKSEIVKIAQDIGTFETSILPYEDCCTIFVPKHPETKPKISEMKRSEEVISENDGRDDGHGGGKCRGY